MGGWDYYCFLCAASFHVPYEIEHDEDDESSGEEDSPSEEQGTHNQKNFRPKVLFPRAVVAQRLQWLSAFRTIGHNRQAPGLSQCYVSGTATEDDYGQAMIDHGEHPNAQNLEDNRVNCYRNGEEETGDLPVHDNCFFILCKAFARARGIDYDWKLDHASTSLPFDLDALFSCLASTRSEYNAYLLLDHTFDTDQYFWADWQRIYDYFDPLESADFRQSSPHPAETDTPETASKHTPSLFDTLPNELLTQIVDLVPQEDLLSFMRASKTTFRLTKSNKFWQRRLRLDAPWLWENWNSGEAQAVNWQRSYNAVMMQAHKPVQMAAKGANVTGLANRKRVWRVCQQVLQLYLETNTLVSSPVEKTVFEEGVTCRYLPVVANQHEPQYKSRTAFFFSTLNDVDSVKHLKLKWAENGALSGIRLTTGAGEVSFGDMEHPGNAESVVDFEPHDWIEKLVLNIDVVESWVKKTNQTEKTERFLAITGMRIYHLAGGEVVLRQDEGYKRLLEPLAGNGIVGLKTQFTEGRITHLGLLENPAGLTKFRPANDPKLLDLLWDGHLPSADLRLQEYYTGYWMPDTGWDLVPMHTLLFGSTDAEQSTMTGFGASADLRCLEIHRSNGSRERIGFGEDAMKVLLVDGPGGERIAGYELTVGALPVGLTLCTTYGRQAVFGKRADNAKHGHTSDRGFGVAGIYCSFAYNSIPGQQLSSLGLVQSPHIERPPMDADRLVDANDILWEPRPPPLSWIEFGPVYGPKHKGEVAVCIDFSRPVQRMDGLFPAPGWLDEIEIGGFNISYGDGNSLDPELHLGYAPQQWPSGADATPESLQNMRRHAGMSMGFAREVDTGKPHVLTNEEALNQPTTWTLGKRGEKLAAVSIWAGEYLHGLQFHSETGNHSPQWGKCGGEPAAIIRAGGKDHIVGLKIVLGSRRLNFTASSLAPQAAQSMSDSSR